jgi:hypothetical protein
MRYGKMPHLSCIVYESFISIKQKICCLRMEFTGYSSGTSAFQLYLTSGRQAEVPPPFIFKALRVSPSAHGRVIHITARSDERRLQWCLDFFAVKNLK